MKAAVFKGVGQVEVEEREMPRVGADEVLIRVRSAALCGTDLKIFRGGHFRVGENETRVLGHEVAGDIVEVGAEVRGWQVGQRVSVVPNIDY